MPVRPNSPAVEFGLRAVAVLFLSAFVVRAVRAYLESGRVVLLLLLLSETLTVVLVIVARMPLVRSTRPVDALATLLATYYFLFFVSLTGGVPLLPSPVPELIQSAGIVLQLSAKYMLGRSFGLLPANRGIVDTGPYRLVRHPIYLSYCIGHIGFLLGYFSRYNLLALLVLYALQAVRMLMEERLLLADAQYAEYAKRVQWRFIPFLF